MLYDSNLLYNYIPVLDFNPNTQKQNISIYIPDWDLIPPTLSRTGWVFRKNRKVKKQLETTSQTLLVGWGQSHGNHVNVPQQPVLGQGQKPAPNLPKANGDGWKFWYQWTHWMCHRLYSISPSIFWGDHFDPKKYDPTAKRAVKLPHLRDSRKKRLKKL